MFWTICPTLKPTTSARIAKHGCGGAFCFSSAAPEPYLPFDGIKKKIVNGICRIAYGGMHLVGLTPVKLQEHWDKAARQFEQAETKRVADYADRSPIK